MPERSLRFGVRDPKTGLHAASWKVFSQLPKLDVYLGCRELKGELKASLHESGRWHVGYSEKFFEERFREEGKPDSRFPVKWQKPPEIGAGVTLASRVVVPYNAATSASDIEGSVNWVDPAPPGEAVEFALMIVLKDVPIDGWPTKKGMGTKLVGSYELSNGDSVWVVHRNIPLVYPSAGQSGTGQLFKGVDRAALEQEGLRGIGISLLEDGSVAMYDMPVKPMRKGTQ